MSVEELQCPNLSLAHCSFSVDESYQEIVQDPYLIEKEAKKLLRDEVRKLRYHAIQRAYFTSKKRFNIVPAGRRSGKTQISKYRMVRDAIAWTLPEGRFIAGAPTSAQAKQIFWQDFKMLVPKELLLAPPNESDMRLDLFNGAIIKVVGLDAPERIEGKHINRFLGDEYGNCKERVWYEHIRPCLSDPSQPPGQADLIGVPEGRNHYFELYKKALENPAEWGVFTWASADIMSASEIESAKAHLDPKTFEQEYLGSFVSFQGRCYYTFTDENVVNEVLPWRKELPLYLCFDFNVTPGVAVIVQDYDGYSNIIDEVYYERDSNTVRICDEILMRYGTHTTGAVAFGDATGGARGTAKISGTDWDIIERMLNCTLDVPSQNPRERVRVNSVNTRMKNTRVSAKCIHIIKDFEGVRCLDDGSIDKKSDPKLTHLTDAFGYFVNQVHPLDGGYYETTY